MPEGGVSKGERKQKQWLERVSSITCASPRLQNLLDRLSTFANIPRKEAKFQNFAKNSLKIYDRETLQELWRVFSAANDTTQVAAAAASITESSKDEKKKGRKRKTHETGEETDSKRPDLDTEDVADEKSPPANSSKFRWSKAIVSVLQQTEDHTLPVKKLRKKVLAEFRHRTGAEMTKKDQIELFMRKLGKTKKLRVEKNQVMLN
ncbi:cell growth-regulating nucleolar protein-like isoform X2 [Oscarella lobularis]